MSGCEFLLRSRCSILAFSHSWGMVSYDLWSVFTQGSGVIMSRFDILFTYVELVHERFDERLSLFHMSGFSRVLGKADIKSYSQDVYLLTQSGISV